MKSYKICSCIQDYSYIALRLCHAEKWWGVTFTLHVDCELLAAELLCQCVEHLIQKSTRRHDGLPWNVFILSFVCPKRNTRRNVWDHHAAIHPRHINATLSHHYLMMNLSIRYRLDKVIIRYWCWVFKLDLAKILGILDNWFSTLM